MLHHPRLPGGEHRAHLAHGDGHGSSLPPSGHRADPARPSRDPAGDRRRAARARAHGRHRPPHHLRAHGRRRGRPDPSPRPRPPRRLRLQHGRRRRPPACHPPPRPGAQAGARLGLLHERRRAAGAAGDAPWHHARDVRRVPDQRSLPRGRAEPRGLPPAGREDEAARHDAFRLARRGRPRDRGADPDCRRRRRRRPPRARRRDVPAAGWRRASKPCCRCWRPTPTCCSSRW